MSSTETDRVRSRTLYGCIGASTHKGCDHNHASPSSAVGTHKGCDYRGEDRAGGSTKRIAFLSEHASPLALLGSVDAGGQNVYVDQVSRHLARLGYAVDVFVRRDDPHVPAVTELEPGARVIQIEAGPARFVNKDALWPLMPAFRDAVAAHLRRARYDLVHGNFWLSGWVAVELGETFDLPVVQIFHATGKTKRRHQGAADTSPAGRIDVELGIVRGADRIIAQCPCEQKELIDDYGAATERVAVIPSAVDIETYRPVDKTEARRRLGLDPAEPVVAYIGRMLPRKDVRNVVRAVALLAERRPVRLLLVGGETAEPDREATPEIGVLQDLAGDLGIAGQVLFTGKRQPSALRWYYGAGDVAVSTPWYEPFGLTPLEAMACGRPMVGSAVGGLTATIVDGETGYLVPPRCPEILAERLDRLLSNPSLAERMGRAARHRVEEHFTWPVVAERTARLYEIVLNVRASSMIAGRTGIRVVHDRGRGPAQEVPTETRSAEGDDYQSVERLSVPATDGHRARIVTTTRGE